MSRRSDLHEDRGITLIELILSILLLNVIILTGMSMEMAMRRVLISTDYEGSLSGEAGAIVTMITKNLNTAIGTTTSPFLTTVVGGNSVTYTIRQDSNGNGFIDAGDQSRGFRYYTNGAKIYEIYYLRNGLEIMSLTNRTVAFTITPNFGEGTATVSLTLRRNPAAAVNVSNPEASIVSFAQARAASVN